MILKPKWLRYHQKLSRLYESCSAELIASSGQQVATKDILSLLLEKNEKVSPFESVELAERIEADYKTGKWREILHDHMLDIRPSISAKEATRNLDHIGERIIAGENELFWLFCYYVSTKLTYEEYGITPGQYLIKAYLGEIPPDKSLAAVWTRAKVLAKMK